MIYLLIVMIMVTVAIIVILLQTKSATVTTQKPQTSATANSTQKATSEKKYVESLNILDKISDVQRPARLKPKLSLTLNNLLVDNAFKITSPQFKENIEKLSQAFDLYIILLGNKDDNPQVQENVLEQFKALTQPHKVILCHTQEGIIAIIRQIKPRFHFENNDFIVERLSQHLNHILGTNELKGHILVNSQTNVKWANILNHNIDFFDNFEICDQPIRGKVEKKLVFHIQGGIIKRLFTDSMETLVSLFQSAIYDSDLLNRKEVVVKACKVVTDILPSNEKNQVLLQEMELLKFLMISLPFNPKAIEWLLSSMMTKFNYNDDFARNLWIGFTSVAFLKEENTKGLNALIEKFAEVIMAPHMINANRGSMRFNEIKMWTNQNFCPEILESIEMIKLASLDNLKSWIELYFKELHAKLKIQFDFSGLLKQFLLYSNSPKVVTKIVEIFETLRNLDNPAVFDSQVEEILLSKTSIFNQTPKSSKENFNPISHSTFEDINPIRREQPFEIFSNAVKEKPKMSHFENNFYQRSHSMIMNKTKKPYSHDDVDQIKQFEYIQIWLSKYNIDQIPKVVDDEIVMTNLSEIENFESFCCFIFEPHLHPLAKNWAEQHKNLALDNPDTLKTHLLAIRSYKTMQTLSDKRNLIEIAKGNKDFFEIYFRLMYNSLSVKQSTSCNLNHIGALTEFLVRFEPEISVGYILHYNLLPKFFQYLESGSVQSLLLTLFKSSKFEGEVLERTYRKLIKYCESSLLFRDLSQAVLTGNQAFEVQTLHVEKPIDVKDSFLFTSIVQQDIQLIRQPSLPNHNKLHETFLHEDLNHFKLDIDNIKPSIEERKENLKKNPFENLFNSFVTTVNHDFDTHTNNEAKDAEHQLQAKSKSDKTYRLSATKLPKISLPELANEHRNSLSNRVFSETSIGNIEQNLSFESDLSKLKLKPLQPQNGVKLVQTVGKIKNNPVMKENADPNTAAQKNKPAPYRLFPRKQTKTKNNRPVLKTLHKEFDNTTFFNEQQKQELDKLYPTSYRMKSPVEKEATQGTFVMDKLLTNDKFCLSVCEFLEILIRKSLYVKAVSEDNSKKRDLLHEKYLLNKNIGIPDVDFTPFWRALFSQNCALFENLLKNYLFKIKMHCVQETNSAHLCGEIVNFILQECLKGNAYLQPWNNQIREISQKYFSFLCKTLIHSHAWIFKDNNNVNNYQLSSAHILLVKTVTLMIENNQENNYKIIHHMDETCWHVLINWFSHNRTNNVYQAMFYKITQIALSMKDENFMLSFFFKLGFLPSLYKIWSEIYQNGVLRQDQDISSIHLYLKKFTHLIHSIETAITDPSTVLRRELKRSRSWEILKCNLLI